MYEKVILWATPVFFLLIAVEILVSWRRRRSEYRVADAINSIALGQMSTYLGVFGRLLSFGIYVLIYEHARVLTLDSGSVWVWLTGLLLYDFLYYWYHRFGHEVNVLWAAHVVHHQSEEFNLSTALRQTGTSYLLSWIFYVPMAVLGFSPAVLLGVGLIDLLYQFWIHTEHVGSLGVFDRLFASPSNHRVHHAVNDPYLDRNYGGLLIVWDRLFGTFQPELAAEPVVYGTRDPLRSWNPLWANLHSYVAMGRDSWHARSWGDKLRVWVKHPGWRPEDVNARFPKQPFRLESVAKFGQPLPRALAAYCVVQAVLVLALGTHFLAVVPGWEALPTAAYLAGLIACLCIIGGLTEGRRAYLWAETLRLVAFSAAVVAIVRPQTAAAQGAITLATVGMMLWLWRAARLLPGRLAAAVVA
jgi:sterol desaturase/sphingolipid hydroxylase (fatty acid hydroxylase superfamily)